MFVFSNLPVPRPPHSLTGAVWGSQTYLLLRVRMVYGSPLAPSPLASLDRMLGLARGGRGVPGCVPAAPPSFASPRATGYVNYPWARPDDPRDQGSSDPSIPVAAASCADPGPTGFAGNTRSLR